MKKTKCTICGEDGMPLYIRVKVDGEEKKGLQFIRFGTCCLNEKCDAIYTDYGLYRKVPPDPVKVAKAQALREEKYEEKIKSVLLKVLKGPEFRELIRPMVREK